jgi:FMN-dependent NADH-azoreductase
MSKILLRIDSSARRAGSHSRALGDHFEMRWRRAHPDGRVVVRDLAELPIPHLTGATIAAFTAGGGDAPGSTAGLSDALVAELSAANDVVVSSPVYNFGAPSPLKAYVDHVVRFGRTFTATEGGYAGLLPGRSACILTARGGAPSGRADDPDFLGPFLQAVFRFLGFTRAEWIALEGTSRGEGLEDGAARARAQVDAWFDAGGDATPEGAYWCDGFSASDRAEIDGLRAAQVRAVLAGDAAAYAELCADDVFLMLQGQDVVAGREAFLACEAALFRGTRFVAMEQQPLRVERQGPLAVEVGRQEVQTAAGATQAAAFRARRKYTHVLRRTTRGWRFAVLMSSNSI